MLGRWSLSILALPLVACGWTRTRPSPKPIPEGSISLSVGRFGTFGCGETPEASLIGDMLDIVCWERSDAKGTRSTTPADQVHCIVSNVGSDTPTDCYGSHDANGPPPTTQTFSLVVPHYHGAGTYTFKDPTTPSEPHLLMVRVAGEYIESVPGSPGIPTTQCTLLLTGPEVLQRPGVVTGHIRCSDMSAVPLRGGARAAPPETAIVEGDFSVRYSYIAI